MRDILNSESAQTSPHAIQLESGFRNLRFIGPLEAQFRSYYNEKNLPRGRAVLLLGAAIFAVFALINYLSLPDIFGNRAAAIQLFLICPVLIGAWFLSFNQGFVARYYTEAVMGLLLLAGLGLTVIIFLAHVENFYYRYEGLILITLYCYFLSGLLVARATAVSVFLMLTYLAVELLAAYPGEELVYNVFYMLSANVIGVIGSYAIEMTERRVYLQTGILQSMAERDGLTGILNRRAFDAEFNRLWKQAQRNKTGLIVSLLDIDNFKAFNDRYGHLAGDDALRRVAHALVSEPHRPLDLVARFGGEEFVAVWFDTSAEILPRKVDELRQAVESLQITHRTGNAGVVTVSAGALWLVPSKSDAPDKALGLADQSLYEAKQAGRNCVQCYRLDEGDLIEIPASEKKKPRGLFRRRGSKSDD